MDPSGQDDKDIIKNARRKLEMSMAAAMPCKRSFSQASIRETVVSKTEKARASEAKTRFSCIDKESESMTKRIHEEHIAGKGQNFVLHYNVFARQLTPREGRKVTLRSEWFHTSSQRFAPASGNREQVAEVGPSTNSIRESQLARRGMRTIC